MFNNISIIFLVSENLQKSMDEIVESLSNMEDMRKSLQEVRKTQGPTLHVFTISRVFMFTDMIFLPMTIFAIFLKIIFNLFHEIIKLLRKFLQIYKSFYVSICKNSNSKCFIRKTGPSTITSKLIRNK